MRRHVEPDTKKECFLSFFRRSESERGARGSGPPEARGPGLGGGGSEPNLTEPLTRVRRVGIYVCI